jgi:hypothetical protein
VRDFASLLEVFRDYFPRFLHACPLLELIHAGEKLPSRSIHVGVFRDDDCFTITLRYSVAWTLGLASLVFWLTLRISKRWRNRAKA